MRAQDVHTISANNKVTQRAPSIRFFPLYAVGVCVCVCVSLCVYATTCEVDHELRARAALAHERVRIR